MSGPKVIDRVLSTHGARDEAEARRLIAEALPEVGGEVRPVNLRGGARTYVEFNYEIAVDKLHGAVVAA